MNTKTTKIIIPIITALAAVVAIFFAAPYKDWKESKEWISTKYTTDKINYASKTNYLSYCISWWKERFTNTTYNGGTLPEVTVTP